LTVAFAGSARVTCGPEANGAGGVAIPVPLQPLATLALTRPRYGQKLN